MNLIYQSEPIQLHLPDSEIIYFPDFFQKSESDAIFELLKKDISWQQDTITVFGKKHLQPRLTALYGNEGMSYSYSNIKMQPNPWTPLLQNIKSKVESVAQAKFTTVLLNYYRDGRDSNGWHADNEKELGLNPIIASLSFGAARIFKLKHNVNHDLKQNVLLEHGSLLVMGGTTQHNWKHQIPKTSKPIGPRINLTFRTIK